MLQLVNLVGLFLYVRVEAVPDYSKLTLTQAKRYEMESQVCESFDNSTLLILLTKCIESPT